MLNLSILKIQFLGHGKLVNTAAHRNWKTSTLISRTKVSSGIYFLLFWVTICKKSYMVEGTQHVETKSQHKMHVHFKYFNFGHFLLYRWFHSKYMYIFKLRPQLTSGGVAGCCFQMLSSYIGWRFTFCL